MSTTVFNPYKEALRDPRMLKESRTGFKRFCCRCSQEKPIAGGTFPQKKGEKMVRESAGVLRRFWCAECIEKRNAGTASVAELERAGRAAA